MSCIEKTQHNATILADLFVSRLDALELDSASVGYPYAKLLNPHARRTEIASVKRADGFEAIFDFIDATIIEANDLMWRFDIERVRHFDYLVYPSEISAHYDWHCDEKLEDNAEWPRKLSFIMLLSDPPEFDGGEFQFRYDNGCVDTHLTAKGQTIIFPSYKMHRVTPVVRGTRRSLVAWAEGPRWR